MPVLATLPGLNGQCGIQHDNAPCFTTQGPQLCCSRNGYCGFDETYCLLSNGCQFGCVDASVFSTLTLAASTTSANSLTTLISSSTSEVQSLANTTTSANSLTTLLSSSTSEVQSLTTTTTSLTSQIATSSSTPTYSSGLTGKVRTGVIIGASVGGVILVVIVVFIIFLCWRRRTMGVPVPAGPATPVRQRDITEYLRGPNWTDTRLEEVG